jgi:hypothetical protein
MTYLDSTPQRMTAQAEYEQQLRRMLSAIELAVLDQLPRLQRLRQVNGIEALVAATAPGEFVVGTTMTRERFTQAIAMLFAFSQWASLPISADIPVSPLVFISKRD